MIRQKHRNTSQQGTHYTTYKEATVTPVSYLLSHPLFPCLCGFSNGGKLFVVTSELRWTYVDDEYKLMSVICWGDDHLQWCLCQASHVLSPLLLSYIFNQNKLICIFWNWDLSTASCWVEEVAKVHPLLNHCEYASVCLLHHLCNIALPHLGLHIIIIIVNYYCSLLSCILICDWIYSIQLLSVSETTMKTW